MNFLVIENDQTTRDAIRFTIENEGHSAEGAVASGQAWARFKGKGFDALLVDLELAQTGGFLVEIRKNHPDSSLIMYSAERSEDVAAEARRSGAMEFLEIPFQRKQFVKVVSQLQSLRKTSRCLSPTEQNTAGRKRHSSKTTPPLKLFGWNGTCG